MQAYIKSAKDGLGKRNVDSGNQPTSSSVEEVYDQKRSSVC